MPYVYPEGGQNHIADASFGRTDSYIDTIAVGSGTTDPSITDSSLEAPVFEASNSTSIVSFEPTSSPGEYVCRIALQGGTEVPGGADITELGLKDTDGDLVYRETRTAVTIDDGSRIVFEFTVDVTE